MQKKTYVYRVTLDIPNEKKTHSETFVEATSQSDAKYAATRVFYNHQFTGVHKYMKAIRQ